MVRTISPQDLHGFIEKFQNPLIEPLFADYLPHLRNLNRIVRMVGERLEGNVFYLNAGTTPGDRLDARFLGKRRNLALLSIASSRVLEIGFNAGYSTLLMLTANPHLSFVSVDICEHAYTRPCVEYLKGAFGARFEFHAGDSREVVPALLARDNLFDSYLIDGGHGLTVAQADLINVFAHARDGDTLCFDDSNYAHLRILLNVYMLQGAITPIKEPAFLAGEDQAFFRINK